MHGLADTQSQDPFPPEAHVNDRADRRDANRAVGVSAVGLALTGAFELVLGLLSGSVALIGDALHNLSDVSTSAAVFAGFRLSRRPATDTHPYGWERAEDLAGLGVALVIWASAAFAGIVSVHKLLEHGRTTNVGVAMSAAGVGIIGNQVVARYKRRVGRRIQSATLLADAQHSWLDALSSAGALAGLAGVALGLRWADAVAGVIVTLFIAHVGWEVTGDLLAHLMDSVEPEVIAASIAAAESVSEITHAHVRARWMGRSLLVDVEGYLRPDTTLGDGETIRHEVERAVTDAVPQTRAIQWIPRPTPQPSPTT